MTVASFIAAQRTDHGAHAVSAGMEISGGVQVA